MSVADEIIGSLEDFVENPDGARKTVVYRPYAVLAEEVRKVVADLRECVGNEDEALPLADGILAAIDRLEAALKGDQL